MKAPLSWLRDYAPLDAPVDRLAGTLSDIGLVVDGVERVGAGLGDVVVARVLAIRPHPAADRIRLVDVDPGDGGPLQVVCGAHNFAEGDLVPLAPVGAVLPGDFRISRRKMRGQESNGMLCSAAELDLPDPSGGAGLLVLAPGSAAPGTPLVEALGVEPDVVFDIDVTANRPDALCMAGVARDLAAALGEEWSEPDVPAPPADPSLDHPPVTVEAGDLCPRFTATVLDGAPAAPAPAWMARRLVLAGMRPISAVVDASNYVMLDLGQPNHAYDLDRLGGGGILVRAAGPGEKLVTLDGVERVLAPGDCVICDAEGRAVGVGGVMGGEGTEIGASTRRILLECAWFTPAAIARTGKRLGLHSEARTRFERGVDPEVATRAVERFAALLAPLAPDLRRGPTTDVRQPSLPSPPVIALRTERAAALLGVALDDTEVERLLAPLGFRLEADGPGRHRVGVPSWRLEVGREADLVEEVARMYGYSRIPRTLPSGVSRRAGRRTGRQRERRHIRSVLAGAGLYEAWTTTFLAPGALERAGLDPAAVEVENPLDRSESLLRPSLLPGLLESVRSNLDRQLEGVALFELGRVFFPPPPGAEPPVPGEEEQLGVVLLPPAAAGTDAAVASAVQCWRWLAASLRLAQPRLVAARLPSLHPGRAARLLEGDEEVGRLGEVDPEVARTYGLGGRPAWLELSLDRLEGAARRPAMVADVSRFPPSDFDLAFSVPEATPAEAVARSLREAAGELLEELSLFDVYRGAAVGDGRRSLAFRVRLRAPDRTLAETELAAVRARMVGGATSAGAALRG